MYKLHGESATPSEARIDQNTQQESLTVKEIDTLVKELPQKVFDTAGEQVTSEVFGGQGDFNTLTTEEGMTIVPETGAIVFPENMTTQRIWQILTEEPWNAFVDKSFEEGAMLGHVVSPFEEETEYVTPTVAEMYEEGMGVYAVGKDSVSSKESPKSNLMDVQLMNADELNPQQQRIVNQARAQIVARMANGTLMPRYPSAYPENRTQSYNEPVQSFENSTGKMVTGNYNSEGKFELQTPDGEPYTLTDEDVIFLAANNFMGGPQSGETGLGISITTSHAQEEGHLALGFTTKHLNQEETANLANAAKNMLGKGGVSVFQQYAMNASGEMSEEMDAISALEAELEGTVGVGIREPSNTRAIPFIDADGNVGTRGVGINPRLRPVIVTRDSIVIEEDYTEGRWILRKDNGKWEIKSSLNAE